MPKRASDGPRSHVGTSIAPLMEEPDKSEEDFMLRQFLMAAAISACTS